VRRRSLSDAPSGALSRAVLSMPGPLAASALELIPRTPTRDRTGPAIPPRARLFPQQT